MRGLADGGDATLKDGKFSDMGMYFWIVAR
jgi:hypothetical protein